MESEINKMESAKVATWLFMSILVYQLTSLHLKLPYRHNIFGTFQGSF